MPNTISITAEADSVGAIERELAELIRRSTGSSEGAPIIRARTWNLIARGDSRHQRDHAVEVLGCVAETQPSRAIILSSEKEDVAPPHLAARLATKCQRVGEKLVCYEQISIDTYGAAGRHVAGVVEPLLVSHLPTCLWWVGDPDFSHETFRQLSGVSDRVIVDSQCFDDLGSDLAGLLGLVTHGRIQVDDLNWQRILPWREILAQLFNGPEGAEHLPAISSVAVKTGGSHCMQCLLLLGWLASRLGWKVDDGEVRNTGMGTRRGHIVAVKIETGSEKDGDLACVELTSTITGGDGHFEVERQGEQVETRMYGASLPELCRTSRLIWPSEPDLLACGLALRGRDTVFEQTLTAAASLLPLIK